MSQSNSNQIPGDPQLDSAENVLRKATFETDSLSPSTSALQAPTSESILSAYARPSTLHPLSNVTADLDYLALDEAALSSIAGSQSVLPNRGWSDELCYGTGTVYVGGLGLGGLWGLREGWQRSKAIAAGRVARSLASSAAAAASAQKAAAAAQAASSKPAATGAAGAATAAFEGATGGVSWRLRLNAILNGITRRGSFTGNTCGILALMYNAFNCTLDRYREQHDNWNSIMAGGLTGALFRCTAGPQKMLIASSLMAAGAMVWMIWVQEDFVEKNLDSDFGVMAPLTKQSLDSYDTSMIPTQGYSLRAAAKPK